MTIAEQDASGAMREVLVTPDGSEDLGPGVDEADGAWYRRWHHQRYRRAEIGRTRDDFAALLAQSLPQGTLLLVDYGHLGPSPTPTLTGYRAGRAVPAVPDGSCDLTAHVRWDSLVERVRTLPGMSDPWLQTQREALRELCGVPGLRHPTQVIGRPPSAVDPLSPSTPSTGPGPDHPSPAVGDPSAYLTELNRRSLFAELTDPDGLGAQHWLISHAGASAHSPGS